MPSRSMGMSAGPRVTHLTRCRRGRPQCRPYSSWTPGWRPGKVGRGMVSGRQSPLRERSPRPHDLSRPKRDLRRQRRLFHPGAERAGAQRARPAGPAGRSGPSAAGASCAHPRPAPTRPPPTRPPPIRRPIPPTPTQRAPIQPAPIRPARPTRCGRRTLRGSKASLCRNRRWLATRRRSTTPCRCWATLPNEEPLFVPVGADPGRDDHRPVHLQRGREFRPGPVGLRGDRRAEFRLDPPAAKLGRRAQRQGIPRGRTALPRRGHARHAAPALHGQLHRAVPPRWAEQLRTERLLL